MSTTHSAESSATAPQDHIRDRNFDIAHRTKKIISLRINGKEAIGYEGETVLTTLLAHGIKKIAKNNHNEIMGAYCGMGVCFCCTVFVNDRKRRSCKTEIAEGMQIDTTKNIEDRIAAYPAS